MAQEQKSLWFRNKVSGVTGAESVFTPEDTPHMKGVGMLVGNFELNP